MGLKLLGKGSILNTLANAGVAGVKDVGDIGSLGLANLTGNQQAAQNARNAISINNHNLSGGNFGQNLGGLSSDIGATQAARAFLATGIGAGTDLGNAISGQNLTPQQITQRTPLTGLTKFATNNGRDNITGGRALAGNTILTGVNLATLGKGKAIEQGIERAVGERIGGNVVGRAAARTAASSATGGLYGAGQGTGTAVATAQTPEEALRDILRPAATNAALAGTIGAVTTVPALTKAAKENAIPLDQVGGGRLFDNSDAAIHANNPMNPSEPKPATVSEPTPADLAQSARAAEGIDRASAPIDFTKVEGANKSLAQAVQARADTLKSIDSGLKGGQTQAMFDEKGNTSGYKRISEHSPFYSKFYAESGHAPRKADWQAEAERQLRSGTDEESQNYQDLSRHADAENELKAYQQADKQSGYSKVRVRNAPAGTPKQIPSVVLDKINSPEYAAKRESGAFLQRVRDELPGARAEVAAADKQLKKLSNAGDQAGIKDVASQSAAARLKLRYLEGQEHDQSVEYSRRAQALDQAHPDAVLKLKGQRSQTTVSGVPVRGGGVRAVSAKAEAPLGEGPFGFTPRETAPYTGPNLNEGAFSNADLKNLESHNGGFTDEQTGQTSYSPEHDLTLPADQPVRDLKGDTAAFNAIQQGGGINEAVDAYKAATGASEAEANKAVGRVIETGADMTDNEAVLRRNPRYNTVQETPVHNTADVVDRTQGYRSVVNDKLDNLAKDAKGMSEHDVQLLDSLRGNPAEDIAKQADNPEQFLEVAQTAKDLSDYNHEIRRQNGDITIYRQNYGAGKHYANITPGEQAAVSGYRDALASTPGFSKARLSDTYQTDATEFGLKRANENFLGDVAHDAYQTLRFVQDRSTYEGLQQVHGNEAVHYGNPDPQHPVQLNNTRDVFATRQVAKEWNDLNHQRHEETGLAKLAGKAYDTASSGVTQLIMVNPGFHGTNLLNQAYIAVGKVDPGGLHLAEGLRLTPEETRILDERRLQAGDHNPTYGSKNQGIISQMTHGVTDLNKKVMSSIDISLRRAAFKDLTEGGLTDREAVLQVNKFMGDKTAVGTATRRFTIFFKFFKTMLGAIGEQVKHPVEQKGTILNTAIAAGIVYGVDKAFQQWTGNKHAHVHVPGELGIAKDVATSGVDIAKGHYGQAASLGLNRVNPVAKEAGQQLFNKDLFTGKDLSSTGRGGHLVNSLVPEAQTSGKVNAGSKSAAEAAFNTILGAYTPHAKSAPAAPSGKANFLNQKTITVSGQKVKVKPAVGNDPTGIDQQNAYFDSLEKAKNTLPAARQKVYDQITAGETDANGNRIGMNDKQARAHYDDLLANPDILAAVVKQKRDYAKATGQPLDPLYTPQYDNIREAYIKEQSTPYKGDDYTQIGSTNQKAFQQLGADRAAYFATQDFSAAPPSERVLPPKFDAQTETDLATAGNLSGSEKGQFINDHPNVQSAYDAIAKYTNDRRQAQGFAPFKLFPKADPETQALINEYDALPQHDGSRGGNKARFQWAQANPDKYAKIQNYFTNVAEFDLANSAGADKYQGATPSQKELKSAYSLGKYSIYKAPDGTYSINPQAAFAAGNAGNAAFSAQSKQYAKNRAARNYMNTVNRQGRVHLRTNAQNKRAATRGLRLRTKSVKVARPKTAKLSIRAASVA